MRDQETIDFGMDGYLASLDEDLDHVDVGITAEEGAQKHGPSSDGKQTDITMAELATIQEFGTMINVTPKMRGFLGATGMHLRNDTTTITIPPRPFMRNTFDEQEKELGREIDRLETQILTKKISRRDALKRIGGMHQIEIQRNISHGDWAANHPYTKDKKGSSQPLIDTGAMRQAINFEVG